MNKIKWSLPLTFLAGCGAPQAPHYAPVPAPSQVVSNVPIRLATAHASSGYSTHYLAVIAVSLVLGALAVIYRKQIGKAAQPLGQKALALVKSLWPKLKSALAAIKAKLFKAKTPVAAKPAAPVLAAPGAVTMPVPVAAPVVPAVASPHLTQHLPSAKPPQ
jgi:hypothetical protein